jgi:hypothetical protein
VKYLAAVTELGVNYPAYINFSRDPETGDVRIIGRQSPKTLGVPGEDFALKLPAVCIELLFEEGLRNLREQG